MDTLIIYSNSCGFFANCNILLLNIITYFNNYQKLPIKITTNNLFFIYKSNLEEDIYKLLFYIDSTDIEYKKEIKFNNEGFENQFSDYKLLNLNDIQPFFQKYFKPRPIILNNVDLLINTYNIDLNDEICGVFYRGNDKVKETQKPPYREFILKAKELIEKNNKIKFIVQTDEQEFLKVFLTEIPNSIYFREVPAISISNDTNCSKLLKNEYKIKHVIDFLSIIYIFSKLKYLITTSGNCEMFITFYRNNTNNLFQYLNKNKYIHGGLNKEYDENNKQVWY
jgi:hypothetical protein